MASNKELIAKIQAIDPNHSLKDGKGNPLNNTGLQKELKRLNELAAKGQEQGQEQGQEGAEQGTDGQEPTPEPTPEPEKEPEKEPEPELDGYRVAKGKCLIVHGRGMIDEGKEIKAEWLPGGEDQLAYLIGKGLVK